MAKASVWVVATLTTAAIAAAAEAADKLAIAPVPAWVVPITAPADDGKAGDAAVKLLLRDEQDDLEPNRIDRYFENVFKVQTPQGLAAGAVSLTWDPGIQVPTVHKLQIRRGAQIIDVLASGQSFTILRRETNLENAVLDGQLTASIQPEGLQIGDIVDFSASIVTSDPAVGGHVEQAAAIWNGISIQHAHLRAQWPSAVAIHTQINGGLPAPKVQSKDGRSIIEIALDDAQPLVLPKNAPARYQNGRLFEMTDMASWNGLVNLMAPLYAKAEVLPATSAVQAEITRIKAASPDPKTRAEAALALVQDRVRYVFLGINDGGLVPADADTTWARRFGDCKGKTVLLLALLRVLDIDAHPVLVSSALGDGLDKRLPEIGLFDHVLVAATIGGRTYWLDGTRVGDRSLDGIETPNFRWGLPLAPGSTQLVAMVPPPYDKPQTDVAIRINATAGLSGPAPIHIDRIQRGDEAVATNLALANLVGDTRDRALREFFKRMYDFAVPTSVTTSYDPVKRELRLAMDGTTKMDWNEGWYEADHVWVGYNADFTRDPGPDRDAPFAVAYPIYTHVSETILLPPKTGMFTIDPGSDVDQTVAGMEYHRHARIDGDRFVVEESDRSIASEFPAAQAPAAQDVLHALSKKSVFIRRPSNYIGTPADISAKLAQTPNTVSGFVEQGNLQMDLGRYQDGIASFTHALTLDPKNAMAMADRGMARAHLGDKPGAKADLDAAQVLDLHNAVVLRARGLMAEQEGRFKEAVSSYTAALDVAPGNRFALFHRARCAYQAGLDSLALSDTVMIIATVPGDPNIRLLRANIMRRKGDLAAAAQEADALVAANPKVSFALVTAGKIYAAAHRQGDAMRMMAAALAIKPKSYIYVNRFNIRPKSDVAGRLADLDEAIKLDPQSMEALATKAEFLSERGDWQNAATTLSAVIAAHPANIPLLARRGIVYFKLGNAALADKDFDAARALAKTADELNELCWAEATGGVALDRALGACDAALALAADAVKIHDSRALVLLRLGRTGDAIAEYDRVLAITPTLAGSLCGRAIAKARNGDQTGAATDMAAALKADPDVRTRFDGYGVTMTATAGVAASRSDGTGSGA